MISSVVKVKLAELLKENDLSLYKLQQDTGISYTTLHKINKNDVQGMTWDVLEKICDRLKCSPGDLIAIEK